MKPIEGEGLDYDQVRSRARKFCYINQRQSNILIKLTEIFAHQIRINKRNNKVVVVVDNKIKMCGSVRSLRYDPHFRGYIDAMKNDHPIDNHRTNI